LLACLKAKSSRTTSEFSGIVAKFVSFTEKSDSRNEIPDTFWKSVGSAVWIYMEIPEVKIKVNVGGRSDLIKFWMYQGDSEWSVAW
jgi:hypothetical protein